MVTVVDSQQIIIALAGVITALAGYIAAQQRQLISDKDKQIDRLFGVAEANGRTAQESLGILKEMQAVVEKIERELVIAREESPRRTRGG
jgi:alkyl hydroperoxide reductase subunit AhpC